MKLHHLQEVAQLNEQLISIAKMIASLKQPRARSGTEVSLRVYHRYNERFGGDDESPRDWTQAGTSLEGLTVETVVTFLEQRKAVVETRLSALGVEI